MNSPALSRTPPPTKRGEARRQAILQSAAELFLEQGYADTSLEMVIRRSGGSRQTLYAQFGNKQGLFEAIIADLCEKMLGPVAHPDRLDDAPETMLKNFGSRLLKLLLAPLSLAMYRLIVAEQGRAPEFGYALWRLGPEKDVVMLSHYFVHQRAKGVLRFEGDPTKIARQFIGDVVGLVHMRAILCINDSITDGDLEHHVGDVTNRYVKLYSSNPSPVSST